MVAMRLMLNIVNGNQKLETKSCPLRISFLSNFQPQVSSLLNLFRLMVDFFLGFNKFRMGLLQHFISQGVHLLYPLFHIWKTFKVSVVEKLIHGEISVHDRIRRENMV